MRRVKFACLEQTLHFSLRDTLTPEETNRIVREEFEQYKMDLDRKRVRYKIAGEDVQEDGSLIVRVKKQYNAHDCGDYLD
mgnify:CR=1 FL=1